MKKLSTRKLSVQLSLIIIISSFSTFLYFIITNYNSQINYAQENVLEKLNAITKTLVAEIDWREHEYLTSTYTNKDDIKISIQDSIYNDLHTLLKKVQKQNNIESNIYTLFINERKQLTFAITSGENPYYRHTYTSAPKEIMEKFTQGTSFGPYMDKHGTWLSSFAPIVNDKGKTIAIVQADAMFDSFLMKAQKKLYGNIIGSTILFIIVTGIVLFYVKKLARIDEVKSNELHLAFAELKAKNKDISDSINYAKKIQKALIPKQEDLKKYLPNTFIFYEPKDVVSGDFPWYFKKDDYIYLSAIDCTGHGVPGAMMSIIGNLLLNDIVNNKEYLTPAELLNKLHHSVVETLKQDSKEGITDGMDVALCRINLKNNEVLYSGAHRPLYLWNNKELLQFKGDRYPVGGVQYDGANFFKDHTLNPKKGESIYFFSDGLQDQFNVEDRKFGPKKIRKIISETNNFDTLENVFRTSYHDWKGDIPQTDDILLIGVQF